MKMSFALLKIMFSYLFIINFVFLIIAKLFSHRD